MSDYVSLIEDAGFQVIHFSEIRGDQKLVEEIPSASKYLERPLLLMIEARKTGEAFPD